FSKIVVSVAVVTPRRISKSAASLMPYPCLSARFLICVLFLFSRWCVSLAIGRPGAVWPANAGVNEACLTRQFGAVNIAQIGQHGPSHFGLHRREADRPELVPFC